MEPRYRDDESWPATVGQSQLGRATEPDAERRQQEHGGRGALKENTDGDHNTAFGYAARRNNTTGYDNTANGANALLSNTMGRGNTANGVETLTRNTTGNFNIASGVETLTRNTTGNFNIASGGGALEQNITGDRNIAIGRLAGSQLQSGDNNIYLGHEGAASDESDTMRLGQDQTRTFIAGISGVPVSGSAILINANGKVGIQASAARYKTDIAPLGTRSQGLFQLRPVTFRYKQDPQGERQYGLVAEEVAAVYPELVTRNAQGAVESVRYQEVIPLLLNELQHQQQQLATQEQEVTQQAQQLAALAAQNAALVARLAQVEEAVARAASLAGR
jgi:Chaperone of endosialidase